jgi:Flp pilus assembly protein TadD/ketosteroid isomerase-like protein
MTFSGFSRASRTLCACVLVLCAASAKADEIADIGKLLKGGQLDQAAQKADAYLASKPRDAQAQFLKGLILTEQNKTGEAIAAFTRLTELYPELPEPYNNLAVLYAGQGQYEKARQALEMAIRTHPSYATAHENLGDVYAKLASQAYDKALQLDSNNPTAQTKLALVRDLIGGTRGKPPVAQASAPATATKPATAPPLAAPAPAPVPAKEVKSATAPVATAAPTPAPVPVKEPAKAGPANEEADIIAAINAWASAWARQDASAYLAAYARDFKLPRGESRQAWEASRKQRIAAPKKIEVRVETPVVSLGEGGVATVKFRQNYKSNIVTAKSTKTLVMAKSGGKWQIREERAGG